MDTMQFNVAGLLQELVGATRQFNVHDELKPLDDHLMTSAPVTGHVTLTRTNGGILVNARLTTEVQQVCSRCLTEFAVGLNVPFSEEFQPIVDVTTGLPLPAPGDDTTFTIDSNHIMDLDEAFRQYALLSIPMAPVCKARCAGLCPRCGRNLNEERCQCPPPPADSRWQALEDYLQRYPGATSSAEGGAKAGQSKKRTY
jgi:uncharacterized protein